MHEFSMGRMASSEPGIIPRAGRFGKVSLLTYARRTIASWIVLVLMAGVTPLAGVVGAEQPLRADIYRQAKAATMLVVATDESDGLAIGSGIVLNRSGLILTNYHVITGSRRLTLYSSEGDVYSNAIVVASDPDLDLAALQLEGPAFPDSALPLAHGGAEDGDALIAVGYPRITDELRLGLAVHATVLPIEVSGRVQGRSRVSHNPVELIQAIGAMNAGNSGGPMVSGMNGEVMGIVAQALPYAEVARDAKGETVASVTIRAGIGYGIPVERVRRWLVAHALVFDVAGREDAPAARHVRAADEPSRIARLHHATGHLLHSMGRILRQDSALQDLALYHLTHARRLDPSRYEAARDLGLALAHDGDVAGGRVQIEDALRLSPRNPRLYTDMGDLAWQQSNRQEAERWYRDALRHAPCDVGATARLEAMKTSQMEQTEPQGWPSSANGAVACAPPSLSASYVAGLELLDLGLRGEALHWYELTLAQPRVIHSTSEQSSLESIQRLRAELRSSREPLESTSSSVQSDRTSLSPAP